MEHEARCLEEPGQSLVLLVRMPQQAEVHVAEDDWTGSTDAAERRKRQNRLHQRTYRRRQKLLKMQGAKLTSPGALLDDANSEKRLGIPGETWAPSQFFSPEYRQHLPTSGLTPSQVQDLIRRVEEFVSQQYMIGSPRIDLLLTLIQFNVFRALVSNTFALGFTLDWLSEDAVSPFNQENADVHDWYCPASLQSTTLQREVSHHPWIDLFPFPALRNNLLLQGEHFNLCHDLVEVCHAPSERSGLIVWSNPWDPTSWEVTNEFIRKWAWMLRGCQELLYSTNYWRGKRGEDEISFDTTPLESAHY